MERYLVKDEETGLLVSVPKEQLSTLGEKDVSPETREKLDEAWEILKRRMYPGK